MKIGKLSEQELREVIFPYLGFPDESVLLKPSLGVDSGVFKAGDNILVASTDPITAAQHLIGRWVVYITTNDVLASGGIPRWFLLNVLLPASTTNQEIKEIMKDISSVLNKMKIALISGHTERTPGLKMPIAIGTAIGLAKRIFHPNNVGIGDTVFVLGEIAVEGAFIIYKEKENELKAIFSQEEKNEFSKFPDMISIYPYAKKLLKHFNEEILWMHDPTEGGVYNGLLEIALATKKVIEVDLTAIQINKLVKKICDIYQLNPYKLLSSGSLITIVRRDYSKKFIEKCRSMNMNPVKVGVVAENHEKGKIRLEKDIGYDFSYPEVDEIWSVLS